ncbi:hypothetical protein F5146DRAFT_1142465 [Armillaria mellea]|nr:hypothetical protein F5146DRAFT_1142465 [Armillaria mellea]
MVLAGLHKSPSPSFGYPSPLSSTFCLLIFFAFLKTDHFHLYFFNFVSNVFFDVLLPLRSLFHCGYRVTPGCPGLPTEGYPFNPNSPEPSPLNPNSPEPSPLNPGPSKPYSHSPGSPGYHKLSPHSYSPAGSRVSSSPVYQRLSLTSPSSSMHERLSPDFPPSPGCHPNFAGAALTLSTAGGAISWSANPIVGNPLSASSSPSKFFFQQSGFPVVSYTVKTVQDVNFALEAKGAAPVIGNTDPSGSNQYQKWFVDCSSCSSADISQTKGKVASGCRMSSGSDTNKQCVTAKGPGPMTLAACDGSGAQLFDFTAV